MTNIHISKGMNMPFEANSVIYSVYRCDANIRLSKIPAMLLTDYDGKDVYRLDAPYFTDALSSTTRLTQSYLQHEMKLKHGTVYYTPDKTEAEAYARDLRNKMIDEKKKTIEQIKADLSVLLKTKTKFE